MHAYRAIQNGDVDTVAIVYGNNQLSASGRTLGTGGGGGGRAGMQMPLPMAYEFPSGLTLVGAYATAARRHMHQFGTTPEQLASISVQTREHAARNPSAMYRDPITVDDVLVSKLVADPLHKLDCCVISDGGCAIILTTEDRARDLAHRPVYVRGAAGGTTHHSIAAMADMTRTAAAVSGPKAFQEAGISPGDVDMFAMYDSFTYTVLVVLEDLGFAPKGEGGRFVTDNGGNLRLGGALPTNTDGGGLSATHPGMRGLFLICEATRQLRGEAGDSQVEGAEIAVAHGSGGWLSTQGTVVLGTEAA
jgi:acetyl-CoA acetyltransferase